MYIFFKKMGDWIGSSFWNIVSDRASSKNKIYFRLAIRAGSSKIGLLSRFFYSYINNFKIYYNYCIFFLKKLNFTRFWKAWALSEPNFLKCPGFIHAFIRAKPDLYSNFLKIGFYPNILKTRFWNEPNFEENKRAV